MKKNFVIILISMFVAQSANACLVFFTNDLDNPVTIVDQENPNKQLVLNPGDNAVAWGSKDQMAFFAAVAPGNEQVVVKQIKCTPTKEVPLTTSTILGQNLDPEYFIVNPTAEELAQDDDCGCDAQETGKG